MADVKECTGFGWCGGPVCHCEFCDAPIWEHDYDRRPGPGPFDEQTREPVPERNREIQYLRWCYTQLHGCSDSRRDTPLVPGYCCRHERWEYTLLSSQQITDRLADLGWPEAVRNG